MLRFKITEEALVDIFSPRENRSDGRVIGMRCVEGLPHWKGTTLQSVEIDSTGILVLMFDDGKDEITDANVRFQGVLDESGAQ